MKDKKNNSDNSTKIIIILVVILLILILLIIFLPKSSHKEPQKEEVETKETYQLAFEKLNYECEAGKEIEVIVNSNGKDIPNDINILSDDTAVATIDDANLECNNCKKVKISCVKNGSVRIRAVYNNKTLATSGVSVSKKDPPIAFDKAMYSCRSTEVIEATIKLSDDRSLNDLKSVTVYPLEYFGSTIDFQNPTKNVEKRMPSNGKDYNIELEDDAPTPASCANCKKIRIKCFLSGVIHYDPAVPFELRAETTDGEIAIAQAKIDENDQTPVHFLNNSQFSGGKSDDVATLPVSCFKKAHVMNIFLAFRSDTIGLKRVYSEDESAVDIDIDGSMVNKQSLFGIPVVHIQINCHTKPGRYDIYVESEDGSTSVLRVGVINSDPPTGPPGTPNIKK